MKVSVLQELGYELVSFDEEALTQQKVSFRKKSDIYSIQRKDQKNFDENLTLLVVVGQISLI